jgi:hypothetical protein
VKLLISALEFIFKFGFPKIAFLENRERHLFTDGSSAKLLRSAHSQIRNSICKFLILCIRLKSLIHANLYSQLSGTLFEAAVLFASI